MKRGRFTTGDSWERRFGYARAVRTGSFVAVSGTVAADREGRVVGGDAYEQTREILSKIDRVLNHAGGSLADAVRLRVYYAGGDVAAGFSRALAEAFPDGAPALTTVRVVALVAPEFLLEIEADAVIATGRERSEDEVPDWDEEAD